MTFKSYVAKRLLQFIPSLLGIIIITFVIIHSAPGDPVYYLAGEFAEPDYIEELREKLGLNKPLLEQFSIYLKTVLRGDLGYSLVYNEPVLNAIVSRAPATILLGMTSMTIALALGIILGVIAARKPYSLVDNVVTTLSVLGYSLPYYWLGMMSIMLFSLKLHWLPLGGLKTLRVQLTGIAYIFDILKHLILPSFCLGTIQFAIIARLTRSNMIEHLSQDYIITARAKGLSEITVIFKHALKNALLPIITVAGMNIGLLLSGAVLIETVFSWPGLGRLMYDALYTRDYPMLMGMFIVVSASVLVANLITDFIYTFFNPRIRYD